MDMATTRHEEDFLRIIKTDVVQFVNASAEIGGLVQTIGSMVERAFYSELKFISDGIRRNQPNAEEISSIVEPISSVVQEIQELRNRNRNSSLFNHLSTISESIVALNWIVIPNTPMQFIADMKDAGDYFGNRVLSTNKGNQQHVRWIQSWGKVMQDLLQYVRAYHRTGFEWGKYTQTSVLKGTARSFGPPPPPPPPPAAMFPPSQQAGGGSMPSALLEDLNRGVGISQILKPVSSKTGAVSRPMSEYKQRALQGGGDAPPGSAPPAPKVYPPVFKIQGRKWIIEHQKNNYALKVTAGSMSESVSIFKCEDTGIEVEGKINCASIDNTKRSTIVLNDVISSVELIRCSSVKLQCLGVAPLVSLDSCDSVSIYLTEKSAGAEIITSKSTSSNICLLKPDGDYNELPVPEQIKTVVVAGKLQSTVMENI